VNPIIPVIDFFDPLENRVRQIDHHLIAEVNAPRPKLASRVDKGELTGMRALLQQPRRLSLVAAVSPPPSAGLEVPSRRILIHAVGWEHSAG
jgi:hypothetical protein